MGCSLSTPPFSIVLRFSLRTHHTIKLSLWLSEVISLFPRESCVRDFALKCFSWDYKSIIEILEIYDNRIRISGDAGRLDK